MNSPQNKKIFLWIGLPILILLLLGGGYALGRRHALPFRVAAAYPGEMLWEEVRRMDECAECHAGEEFHRCSTCHDDHGAVEFADVPFFGMITFTGDVPQPGVVEINEVLPYRDQPNTHLPLLDFLEGQGVTDFESVTLTSRDGGWITIERENLTREALLLPYVDGIRFAAENLHVSTWIKGLTGMVVVGEDQPLTLNGEPTSIGRLLLGPSRLVTVEQARVMYAGEEDGEIREARTAFRVQGAAVAELLAGESYTAVLVEDQAGDTYRFSPEEMARAVLVSDPEGAALVLPDRGRSGWVNQVIRIWTE